MRDPCANGRASRWAFLCRTSNDQYATQVLSGVEELLIEEGYFYLTGQPSGANRT